MNESNLKERARFLRRDGREDCFLWRMAGTFAAWSTPTVSPCRGSAEDRSGRGGGGIVPPEARVAAGRSSGRVVIAMAMLRCIPRTYSPDGGPSVRRITSPFGRDLVSRVCEDGRSRRSRANPGRVFRGVDGGAVIPPVVPRSNAGACALLNRYSLFNAQGGQSTCKPGPSRWIPGRGGGSRVNR